MHENLLDRKRSWENMQFDLVKLEIKLKETWQEVMNYHTLNQNLNANIDPIIVDRLRAMVLKSMEDL